MPSRDLWSRPRSPALADLLESALLALLLHPRSEKPAYFCSPWMTDFPLADNASGRLDGLLPERLAAARLSFGDYLGLLSRRREVRVILVDHAESRPFAGHAVFSRGRASRRFAPASHHEKGVLAPTFYLEGSMNLTGAGVHARDEKVTFHAGPDAAARIAEAYLEFGRLWESCHE